MIIPILVLTLAASVAESPWPPVAASTREFVFSDGQEAKVDVPIVGRRGVVLYRLLCRTWQSAGDAHDEFDYSGDFECRLVTAEPSDGRGGSNLLADEEKPTSDWQHRGRFLRQEFVGDCLDYPGYGPERTFQLRGMKLVLSLADWTLEPSVPNAPASKPGFRRFVFRVSVDVDPSASGAYAAAVPFDLPCCLPVTGSACEALDCARPRARGSLCPQAEAAIGAPLLSEPPSPVTTAGWGPVRVGMSLRDASSALGSDLVASQGLIGTDDCHYRTSTKAPGLLFMLEEGRIVRVETRSATYSTPSGVRVGDTEASARKAYAGRAVLKPHKYSPRGHYLVVPTADRKRAVVIETDEGRVVAVRGGQEPAVEYVEGCS